MNYFQRALTVASGTVLFFSLSLVFSRASLAGNVVNICGRPLDANGVAGWSNCDIPPGPVCGSADGQNSGGCWVPSSLSGGDWPHVDVWGCDSDSGNWYECSGAGGYFLGRAEGAGNKANIPGYGDSHCKVQFDAWRGSDLVDFLVWRNPSKCSAPPPQNKYRCSNYTCIQDNAGGTTTDPNCGSGCGSPPPTINYTAISPKGGAVTTSTKPTFVWSTNNYAYCGYGWAGQWFCTYSYLNICAGSDPNCNVPIAGCNVASASSTSCTMATPLAWNTAYTWLVYGQKPDSFYSNSGGQSFRTPPNPLPTMMNVTINSASVIPNNSTQYVISSKGSDPVGAGDIYGLYALVNYQGEFGGNYRGYLMWNAGNSYPNNKNNRACSGGGYGGIYPAYGDGYVTLDACSISDSGTTRTALFTVRFAPSFTTSLTDNDISGYVYDSSNGANGWTNFNTDFALQLAPSISNVTINSSAVQANGSSQYTITHTAADPNSGADIGTQYVLVNYQGTNAGTYRGYVGWSNQGFPTWGGAYSSSPTACTGGGSFAKYNGYGPSYINLLSCSTSVSGNTRTTTFTVSFNSSFTSPASGNTLSGWVQDGAPQAVGWNPYGAFSVSSQGTLSVTTTPATLSPQPSIVVKDSNGVVVGSGNGPSASVSLPPGTYSVTYGSVANYDLPIPNPKTGITLTAGNTTSVTGAYTAQSGILQVTVTVNGVAPVATFTPSITIKDSAEVTTIATGTIAAGTASFTNLPPATYKVVYGPVSGYTPPANKTAAVLSNQTVTVPAGDYTIVPGTISGYVFNDDGSGGGTASDGIKNGGEPGVGSASIYLVSSSGSANVVSGAAGLYSFPSSVNPSLKYHLELGYPSGLWTVNTSGNGWSDSSGAHAYDTGGPRPYTKNTLVDPVYPITVTPGGTSTVSLGLKAIPAGNVSVRIYNDASGDGTISGGESLVSTAIVIQCSSTVAGSCAADNATSGGALSLTLASGRDYVFTFDPAYGTNAASGFVRASGGSVSAGGTCSGVTTRTCTFSSLPTGATTVDFYITSNSSPWVQVWDGDVYSNFHNSVTLSAVQISVNTSASGTYHPFFIQTDSAGGFTLTPAGSGGASCPSVPAPCSENGWNITSYAPLYSPSGWPDYLDSYVGVDGSCSNNVCYAAGSITIDNSGTYRASLFQSGGAFYNKLLIVNGDITIQTNGVASGHTPAISAILVARGGSAGSTGKFSVEGPSTNNELTLLGSVLAKDYHDFARGLNDNRVPATVVIYNPAILLNPSSVSLPTYTWREITP